MSYAVVTQFVALVGEAEARALATPSASAPGYDATKIQGALDRASATLDSYFATRFTVPLAPVPDIVATNACILAREELDRQGRDFVVKAADRVRAWAKDVAAGRATLGVDAASPQAPATSSGGSSVLIDAPARVFTDAGLAAFLGNG